MSAHLEPHQMRVLAEKEALDDNLRKLGDFLRGTVIHTLPAEEQGLLRRQHSYMALYSAVLGQRITGFTR